MFTKFGVSVWVHFDLLKLESSTFLNLFYFSMKFGDIFLSLDAHISKITCNIDLNFSAPSLDT